MTRSSYEDCLRTSHRINWRIDEVLDGRRFDPDRDWLPRGLSAADHLPFLGPAEQRRLTHVEMAAYAHLFSYAEGFVAPLALEQAREVEGLDRGACDALTNFAAEEVKHRELFRQLRALVDEQLGFELERLGGEEDTARFVLGKHRGAVLLLTACIEWYTQRHYTECFQDSEQLDPLTTRVFRSHWLEESQHARLDDLETLRTFEGLGRAEREQALDDLLELVTAFDGLLVQQAEHDRANFRRVLGRPLGDDQEEQLLDELVRAKRHTFLLTGFTHPQFGALLAEVTDEAQRARVDAALIDAYPALAAA